MNKCLGNAYKQHLRQESSTSNASVAVDDNFTLLHSMVSVGKRNARVKPWPASKRDSPVVLHAYKQVCVGVGSILCKGEGNHLLKLACKPKPPPVFEANSREGRMFKNMAKLWLTTENAVTWKMCHAQLCTGLTLAAANACLRIILTEEDDAGNFVVRPRLARIRARRDADKPPMGRQLFAVRRHLHAYWCENNGRLPSCRPKCRIDRDKVMTMAAWIYRTCGHGWRPGMTRSRVVGNVVTKYPYYLRDMGGAKLEAAYYNERSQIYAANPSKTDPGRGTLRLLLHYLTAPMTLKECLSSYYVRFIFYCKKMYTDLLTAFYNLAVTITQRRGEESLPPLSEFTDKLAEVNAMVHFAKHEYRQKHLCVHTAGGHDACPLHCVAHQVGGCPHCKCEGQCMDACHSGSCPKCEKFRRWGVNMQMFLFRWKSEIDRSFEEEGLMPKPSITMQEEVQRFHEAYVSLYEIPLPYDDAKALTTSSCQVVKQYSYVVKYFGTHTVRALWESTAAINAVQFLLSASNVGVSSFVLITDHKAKKNPSKSETEQGYDMGLRGMSTHGFQLTFAVMMGTERHLVTVQYNVFYVQTSDQLLPEAMSAVRLVMNQIGRDFPWLRDGTVISDKCNTLQAFEQIIFVRAGNYEGWTTASHFTPSPVRIAVWTHSEAGDGKDTLDAHFGWLEVSWNTYLRCDGDIVSPRDMFDASIAYPVANTSYILVSHHVSKPNSASP